MEMKKIRPPLTGWSRRLPTATFNRLQLRGKHENFPLAWKILAARLESEAQSQRTRAGSN